MTLFLFTTLVFSCLSYWTDYQLNTIFNKDIHFAAIFASLFTIALLTPKGLHGIVLFALTLGQLYIWFLM
jgi:uncharacterized membrane protein